MHQGNREWLAHCQSTYSAEWQGAGILEIGSLNINGAARDYLKAKRYIGIDKEAGEGVEIICDALKTRFTQPFSCLVCVSVLEHTAEWCELLQHNLQWVHPQGLLLLSWGAEGNKHHAPEPWKPVPVEDVTTFLADRVQLLEAYWEAERFTPDCDGCYNLVGRLR